MEIIIDTSAVLAVVLNEPQKAALVELTTGAELVAPASLPWEVGNAFSAMLKRGRITLPDARRALSVYELIPIRFLDVDLEAALSLAARHNTYAYDAYMLACAEARRSPLLTLDSGLIHAAKNAGIDFLEVAK